MGECVVRRAGYGDVDRCVSSERGFLGDKARDSLTITLNFILIYRELGTIVYDCRSAYMPVVHPLPCGGKNRRRSDFCKTKFPKGNKSMIRAKLIPSPLD